MDLKRYEKTRYQNIYRNKRNKNYMIMLSNPKTSISTINGKKIFDIDEAKKIRDNPKIRLQKKSEIKTKNNFDELWDKYIFECRYVKKQAYNTYHKKEKIYNSFLKNKFDKPVSKITKDMLVHLINELDTTEKQKNEVIKQLRVFFNWCIENELLLINPMVRIKNYKTPKVKMKYWTTSELKQFFNYMEKLDSDTAYRTLLLVQITFSLGDRIGETRALTFGNFDTQNNKVYIWHSINYDPQSTEYLSNTKTYHSQRAVDISPKLANEIIKYKQELIKKGYNINDDSLIFSDHKTNKPISDTKLRKDFYKYSELAGVTKIRLYDLRHTYVATMMEEEKELYLVSERIGHSNYSTTVNKYGHLSNKIRKEVALATDKYL